MAGIILYVDPLPRIFARGPKAHGAVRAAGNQCCVG
jgi:hypothetical protein